jgi:GntR family transcriptional regulator
MTRRDPPERREAAGRSLFDATYGRLVAAIAAREWDAGQKLPSEVELAARLGVSRPVLREVLRELERAGQIVRRHGAGTFVATPPPIEARLPTLVSLERIAASASMRVEEVERSIELVTVGDGDDVAPLSLAPGETMWRIRRVKAVGGRRALALVDHLAGWLVAPERIENALGASVFDLVVACAGTPTVHVVDRIVAEQADESAAARLAVAPGTVLVTIEKTVSRPDGTVLQNGRGQHVAEYFDFIVESRIATGDP